MRSLLLLLALGGACAGPPAAPPPVDAGVIAVAPADAAPPDAREILQIHVAAVGDIQFGRYRPRPDGGTIYDRVVEKGDPFVDVGDDLRSADVTIGNLESPMVPEPAQFYTYETFTFRAEPADAQTLAAAGFDLIALANNHIGNLGIRAALASRPALAAAGITAAGVGATFEEALAPVYIERSGARVGFIAVTMINNGLEAVHKDGAFAYVNDRDFLAAVLPQVRLAREHADFVIVSVHWGVEYTSEPETHYPRLARAMLDAGADMIVGHHPHVVQTFARRPNGLIAYSLGNFLFDQGALEKRQSVILHAVLEKTRTGRRVVDTWLVPVVRDSDHIPRLPRKGTRRVWVERLATLAPGFRIAEEPPDPAPATAPTHP